ncbi:MAG: radical SAM protein [Candidatus Omnitrophica bacterium]|nr:radical SAM protein [Candidatus Omnitrophota bacterium]
MKIVLVNLPWKKANRWGVRAGSRWPHIKDHTEDNYLAFPFYLAYAAGLLKKNGFDVYVIDGIAEKLSSKAFCEKISGLRPDLLVAETSTVTLWYDVNFLRQFKGRMSIALCGPDIHISRSEFLQSVEHIDYTLFGEYEATLLELAQTIQTKRDLGNVKGMIYRAGGKVIKNPPRPLIADLDWLPWPLREQLPIKRYNDSPGDIPIPCASMWASRGCPFRCSFCLWPQVMYNGNTYRTRSVKNVVDEMEYLIKKLGFKSIYFDDDTWNIGKERIFAFCDELQRRELKIPWAIMARAELMDEELLEKMHQSGLFAVKYGVESSSQQILNNTCKGLDLKKTEEVIKYTKYLGIKTHLTFTFGLPGETERTIKETIDYALKLNPTSVQFSIATPFPGTRFYEEMEKKGYILTKSLEKLDGNHSSVIRTESLSGRQLQKAKNRAYQVWQRHCRLRRKNTLSKQQTLKLKVLRSLKTYGIGATLLKAIRYILRRLFFLPVRIKHFFGRKLWIVEETVSSRHLTLRFGEGKIRVYWKDKEISKDVGLTTSFHYGDNWFDSSQANWKLEKQDGNKITVKLKWDDVPVRQEWKLSLTEDTIFWSSTLLVERSVQLLEYKAGIMIQDAYNMWQDDLGTGEFPKITDWEEIELYNANSRILAVMKKDDRGMDALPDLELRDNGKMESNTYPQIQNTDARIKARLLQIRRLKIEQFLPGN